MLTVHWLRLPHPATHLGWIALSLYLAAYLPLFVWLGRVAVHRVGLSLLVAAPVVWTGLELARAHLLTGFLMAAWGHTQYRWIGLIQISDLAGGYAVSFVLLLTSAAIARAWPQRGGERPAIWPLATAAMVLLVTVLYGHLRQAEASGRRGPRVAIIQGSVDPDWKMDDRKRQELFDHYVELSLRAVRQANGPLDLIVWPETMFPGPLVEVDPQVDVDGQETIDGALPAAERPPPEPQRRITERILAQLVEQLASPLMVGLDTWRYTTNGQDHFNSATLIDRSGRIVGRYDKMHLVMFGEYVPFARWFPWIYQLTPIGGGLSAGEQAVALETSGYRYAPSICFETILPQTIRQQVRHLQAEGNRPDVLVSLTNDGWFYGSSELEMHLVCGVFRAVECRIPLLIAANTGISASIDADGHIVKRGPKRKPDVLLTEVALDDRDSFYLRWGDWFAGTCLVLCGLFAALGIRR
jgi:apolipoprotein N-acyltransferase